jgi:hypothetical protein
VACRQAARLEKRKSDDKRKTDEGEKTVGHVINSEINWIVKG